MKAPKTMPELREALAYIMAGAINGDVKQEEGRMALNAATRIIESVQAETRARALAFATNQVISPSMQLAGEIFTLPPVQNIESS
jgi:aromatic ring hydroxylase